MSSTIYFGTEFQVISVVTKTNIPGVQYPKVSLEQNSQNLIRRSKDRGGDTGARKE